LNPCFLLGLAKRLTVYQEQNLKKNILFTGSKILDLCLTRKNLLVSKLTKVLTCWYNEYCINIDLITVL